MSIPAYPPLPQEPGSGTQSFLRWPAHSTARQLPCQKSLWIVSPSNFDPVVWVVLSREWQNKWSHPLTCQFFKHWFGCTHSSVFLVPVPQTFLTWHLSSHFPVLLPPFGMLSSSFMSKVNVSCSSPGVAWGFHPSFLGSHTAPLAHPRSGRPLVWTIVDLKWEEHTAQMEPRISDD